MNLMVLMVVVEMVDIIIQQLDILVVEIMEIIQQLDILVEVTETVLVMEVQDKKLQLRQRLWLEHII